MFFFISLGIGLIALVMVFMLMSRVDKLERKLSAIAKRLAPQSADAPPAAVSSTKEPGAHDK